jgi:NTP pyrophosphatase (non-canonical NTP hydrolase)
MKALLIHAAEEAGEFIQAAMKKARADWGLKNLTDEAADLAAFITLIQEQGLIDGERFARRRAMKLNKFRRKYGRKENR